MHIFYSGGSDNIVNLWRIASCSSAPWLKVEDEDNNEANNDPPDVKVIIPSFEHHSDVLYL